MESSAPMREVVPTPVEVVARMALEVYGDDFNRLEVE